MDLGNRESIWSTVSLDVLVSHVKGSSACVHFWPAEPYLNISLLMICYRKASQQILKRVLNIHFIDLPNEQNIVRK